MFYDGPGRGGEGARALSVNLVFQHEVTNPYPNLSTEGKTAPQ